MIAPDIVAAIALEPYVVRVVFADGQVRDVDIEPLLDGPVFAPLRVHEEFARVRVDEQTRTVAWPNGADLDPDVIYRCCAGERRACRARQDSRVCLSGVVAEPPRCARPPGAGGSAWQFAAKYAAWRPTSAIVRRCGSSGSIWQSWRRRCPTEAFRRHTDGFAAHARSEGAKPTAVNVVSHRTTSSGVSIDLYTPVGEPTYGAFELE